MSPVIFLRVLLIGILGFMIYITITTSLESNLFEEWNYLTSIPLMNATLADFFFNVVILLIVVWYRERTILAKILWTLFFVSMGSMASCIYFLVTLFKMNKDESLSKLFQKK